MSDWQPIETAPCGCSLIFIDFCNPLIPGVGAIIIGIKDDDGWRDDNDDRVNDRYKPTHWMPLPEPPIPLNNNPEE